MIAFWLCVQLLVWCGLSFDDLALAQEIVTLSTRANVPQSYFLTSTPKQLQAVAVLFPGSGGLIQLRMEKGRLRFAGGNFLARSRAEFVGRGVIAAIVDAPSDRQSGWGMSDEFRLADDHLTDIAAVVADLEKRFAKVPLLFARHVSDPCRFTPYGDAARLSECYPLITVWGGLPPESSACEAPSQHGFFGKEPETVEQIVNWMLKKPFLYEVK